MSTLIPNDPRLRKTFTHLEPDYTDQHNRNWTETVEQANDLETRLDAADAARTTIETNLTTLSDAHDATVADVATKTPLTRLTSALNATALCTVSADVALNDAAVSVSLTASALETGDLLIAFDPATGTRTALTVASDTAKNSLSIAIEAAPAAVPTGAIVLLPGGTLRARIAETATLLATNVGRIDANETALSTQSTLISQTADDVTLLATRTTSAEGRLTTNEASIQATSDAVSLKASQSALNTLTGRVDTAEASLTVQAGQISTLVADVDATNDTVVEHTTQINQTSTDIGLLTSRVVTAESGVDTVTAGLNVQTGRIDTNVESISTLNANFASVSTQINQNATNIGLKATKLDVGSALRAGAFATLTAGFDVLTAISEVQIAQENTDDPITPKVGDRIILVNKDTLDRYILVVDAEPAGNTIPVADISVRAPAGSSLYYNPQSLFAQLNVRADEIEAKIGTVQPKATEIGRLTVALPPAVAPTSLSLDKLELETYDGDEIRIYEVDGTERVYVVNEPTWLDSTNDGADGRIGPQSSATPIAVDVTGPAPTAEVPIGTGAHVSVATLSSRFSMTRSQIDLSVTDGTLLSKLTVALDGITAGANVLKSGTFDGTVDGTGNITSDGTAGWALSSSGEIVANNIRLRNAELDTNPDAGSSSVRIYETGGKSLVEFQKPGGGIAGWIEGSDLSGTNRLSLFANASGTVSVSAGRFYAPKTVVNGTLDVNNDARFFGTINVPDPDAVATFDSDGNPVNSTFVPVLNTATGLLKANALVFVSYDGVKQSVFVTLPNNTTVELATVDYVQDQVAP